MAHECISCKKDTSSVDSSTKFICPECRKAEIVRCGDCRQRGTRYTCECGFQGP